MVKTKHPALSSAAGTAQKGCTTLPCHALMQRSLPRCKLEMLHSHQNPRSPAWWEQIGVEAGQELEQVGEQHVAPWRWGEVLPLWASVECVVWLLCWSRYVGMMGQLHAADAPAAASALMGLGRPACMLTPLHHAVS